MVLVKRIKLIWKIADNRRFPSSPGICIKTNEVQCTAFDMEMIFHLHANTTHFHKKGCALGLILKVRGFGTRKLACLLSWTVPSATPHGYTLARTLLPLTSNTVLLPTTANGILSCVRWERSILPCCQYRVYTRMYTKKRTQTLKRNYLHVLPQVLTHYLQWAATTTTTKTKPINLFIYLYM